MSLAGTVDGTDGDQVSAYFCTNQMQLLENIKEQPRKSREVVMLPAMHQIRTTRRMDGDYTLQKEDAYRHMDDSIAAVGDCVSRDQIYEIPYRCLVRTGFDNVITAGRCASADGYAWEVIRVIPPAILMGQAAGMAVAQAMDAGCAITDVSMPKLQKALEDAGVMIHFDDAWIPQN